MLLQSEYVSARDKRREFVSGFTGSTGKYCLFSFCCYSGVHDMVPNLILSLVRSNLARILLGTFNI